MESKHFELYPGEVHEEKINLEIPPIKFPAKVKLVLTSPYNLYDAHYWLKSPEEYHAPIYTVTSTPEFTPAPVLTSQVPNQTSTPNQTSLPAINNITSIKIDRNFGPKSVNIGIGGKVVWLNNDVQERKMTLVSKEGLFTQEISIDKKFGYTFEKSGTYRFYLKEIPSVECDIIVN
jgi:plastocyanin